MPLNGNINKQSNYKIIMEDNSKNTLLGWDAINDVFSNDPSKHNPLLNPMDVDDDLSDEELEELQKQSSKFKKSVKDVFGDQAPDKDKDEDEEEEETEEDIDNVEEEDTKPTKSTKKSAKKQIDTDTEEDDVDTESDEDEDQAEQSKVTALFDAIAEELEWEFDEDDENEKKPSTVEELVSYFKEVIEENSTPQYASEDVAKLDEFVKNGGNLREYFTVTPDIDYDNFDTTVESNQKQIVRALLIEKGFNDKQIARKIEKYEDAGILEDEAEDALESMKEIRDQKQEQLLEAKRIEHEQIVERQQMFVDGVVQEINSLKDIRGIKIPDKDKKALLAYIFKADASGKTQYQKDYSKSVKNLIESAYFTMKGDTLLDTAKKMGTSSAMKNLKQSLRSTGVGKGVGKRINTSSTNDIFSRAVQQLH